jgi:tetratricopeptide (TPR) repeat protein
MPLWGKWWGRRSDDAHHSGVALCEQGRYAEALPLLRAAEAERAGKAAPLTDFHLRQCLTQQGRLLVSAGDPAGAVPLFAEAASRWPTFPDLHFWHGIALASTARWEEALDAARAALHYNADYVEGRLLEAVALGSLGASDQAAASLNELLASGRRVEHPLIRHLAGVGRFTAENLPDNLLALLRETADAARDGDRLRAAVESCRSGDWDEGIARMRELCAANPTYPDHRVRLAAALFQTGRNAEALAEVDQALHLNPRYRTAAHLKALILADQHRFRDAREVILAQQELTDPVAGHPGEALFCAYLNASLALLTGRRAEARAALGAWHDLAASFPMAELLLAAADELDGREVEAHRRLEDLCDKWFLDADYHNFLGCHLLAAHRWDRLGKLLAQWPRADLDKTDRRRAYLASHLKLALGGTLAPADIPADTADEPAWRLLRARALAASGDWLAALPLLRALADEGEVSEPLATLLVQAYLVLDDTGEGFTPDAVSDKLLQERLGLLHRQERSAQSAALLGRRRELTPEDLRWTWLDPSFWLEPIRRWIG